MNLKLYIKELTKDELNEKGFSQEELKEEFQIFTEVIQNLIYFPEIEVFFNTEYFKIFSECIDSLSSDMEYFLTDPIIYIKNLLEELEEKRQTSNLQEKKLEPFYYFWNSKDLNSKTLDDTVIPHAYNNLTQDQPVSILLFNTPVYANHSVIPVIHYNYKKQFPQLKNIEWLKDFESFLEWKIKNYKMEFYLSNKHGELGKGNWKNASKLKCSKEQAQELLDNSIGLIGKTQRYNYDKTIGCFIKFEDNGENLKKRKYHGYHIENNEIKKYIPEEIIQYYKK